MLTGALLFDLFGLFIAFITVVVTYFKWSFTYWKKRGVPYLEPTFPFGNLDNPAKAKIHIGLKIKALFDELRSKNLKHGGIFLFAQPTYLPVDLDYIKNVLTKDFQHFVDRGMYYNEKDDPLSAHLFALGGSKWKNMRVKLTPTFTSGKMKMMFQTLLDCDENLLKRIENLRERNQAIDIKDVLGCFTTDIIGSVAFGLDCNTFKEEESPFRVYGKKIVQQSPLGRLKTLFMVSFPKLARSLKMRLFPKDVTDFFFKVVKDTVDYREKNSVSRKDFIQLLIDLKNNKLEDFNDGSSLTINEVAAQSLLFFLAGFETSSTTMTFALYELAKNQDIQEKVREEINTVLQKYEGKITYDAIQEMKYMQQVLDETLRKYPPATFITRDCVQDYKIPDDDIIIEKGTRVIIPILGIHYNEEYYPDPQKFDPERFNEENSKARHQYAHIPFGEGPRICIGMRFGLMQSKVGLASLLQKHKFTVNEKTQEPLKFTVNSFVLAAEGDIWLNAEKI